MKNPFKRKRNNKNSDHSILDNIPDGVLAFGSAIISIAACLALSAFLDVPPSSDSVWDLYKELEHLHN